LKFTGKLTKENQKIIDDYKEALRLKTELGEKNFGSKFFAFSPSFKNGIEDVFGKAAKKAVEVLETLDVSDVFASALNTATGAVSGAKDEQGALKGVGDILTGALTAFLGPVGTAIGGFITQIVLLGKDNAREFIKNLVRAIPEFIIAFVEAIPALVEGIVEVFSDPGFWFRLVEAIGIAFARIIFQLPLNVLLGIRKALPELSQAFTRAFEASFKRVEAAFARLPKQIADFIKNALTNLFSSVVDVFKNLIGAFKPLIDAMNTLAEAVRSAGGAFGRGGGKGLIAEGAERVGGALGLARGGIVPAYAANGMFVPRGTDTVPAMLTPGELVVPTGMVKKLDDFMSNGGVNPKYEAMFMSILAALQKPMVVNAEAKVNQSAFADIVLQLNRQNSRLGI
jgi:hypothetical protein